MLIGVGVNVLDLWWERAEREREKKKERKELRGVRDERKSNRVSTSQLIHCYASLYAQRMSSSGK